MTDKRKRSAALLLELLTATGLIAFMAVRAAARGQADAGGVPDRDQWEFWRYLATQSGLLVALLVTLWSYRKTLLGLSKDEKEGREQSDRDRDRLADIVEANTTVMRDTAVAASRQTDATHRLARVCERFERDGNERDRHDRDRDDKRKGI